MSPLRPHVPSMVLCPLSEPLTPLPPSAPLQSSVLSTTFCLLYGSFPLYDPLSPLRPSVLFKALCLLYSSLSPLWPSIPSTALCPLCGPLKNSETSKTTPNVSRNVLQNAFHQNLKGYWDLFHISDNRDSRDKNSYHSSEIIDNHEISIIAVVKKSCDNRDNHIQQVEICNRISRKI
jgi:hypothetical protein